MRAGKVFILLTSNEDMNDIVKTIKSLEYSNILIDGITETAKHEKKTRRRIPWCYVSTFSRFISVTNNFFNSKWKRN